MNQQQSLAPLVQQRQTLARQQRKPLSLPTATVQQSLAPIVQPQQQTLAPIVQQRKQNQTLAPIVQPLSLPTATRQQTLAPIVQQQQRKQQQRKQQQRKQQQRKPLSLPTVTVQQTLAPIVQQQQLSTRQNVDFDLLDQEYIQNKQLYEQAKRRFEQDILKSNSLQQFSSILQPQTMFPNVNPQNVQSYSMSSRSVYNNGDFYNDVESRQNVHGKITQKSRLIEKKKGQKPKIVETPTTTYYQTQPKYIE